jgi:hypothetical protein
MKDKSTNRAGQSTKPREDTSGEVKPGKYFDRKGNLYIVIGEAVLIETGESLVICRRVRSRLRNCRQCRNPFS